MIKFNEIKGYELLPQALEVANDHAHNSVRNYAERYIDYNTVIVRCYNEQNDAVHSDEVFYEILIKVFGPSSLYYEINLFSDHIDISMRPASNSYGKIFDKTIQIDPEHYDLTEEMFFQMSLVQNIDDIDYSHLKTLCYLCSLLDKAV